MNFKDLISVLYVINKTVTLKFVIQTQLLCMGTEIAIHYLMNRTVTEIRQPAVPAVFIPR
jgi:hypothetical protein